MSNKCKEKEILILKSAAQHFACSGFAGARMDEIADAAKVNKATIYYHIGDKQALYDRVYCDMLDPIIHQITETNKTLNDPLSQLRVFIKTVAIMCEKIPYMSPMILREVASGGSHLSSKALEKMQQIRSQLVTILTTGEAQGKFKPVNQFMIHMIIIGCLNFYAAGKPIRDKLSTFDLDESKQNTHTPMTQVAEEIAELLLNSICIK